MKTLVTLQVALTEADISQHLTISIFLGTVETNFIHIMCEKRSSQKFLQRFLKEIFCSGVRAFF
jgi:hypothetical protein